MQKLAIVVEDVVGNEQVAVDEFQISDHEETGVAGVEFDFLGSGKIDKVFPSSDSDSDSEGSDDDLGEAATKAKAKKARKPNLPRLNEPERMAMENWVAKPRSDGLMLNARWIRHGGAKGKNMTATSGEVKTLGAYVALALYVNKKLSYSSINPRFWSTEDAQRRWKSLYSSYVDALKEEDKGNSLAGVVRQTSDKQAQH